MSSSEARDARRHARSPHLAHHFDAIEKQNHAVRLGMWLFLATEILLFAGLFLGYAVYRYFYHEAFHEASRTLDLQLGAMNTVVLITCSFTVALALLRHKQGKTKARAPRCCSFTILCALRLPRHQGFEYCAQVRGGRAARAVLLASRGHAVRARPLLHDLLPDHGPARVPRHRRHERPHLGADARRSRELRAVRTTSRSSWAASTGTSSTWSGSSFSRCST